MENLNPLNPEASQPQPNNSFDKTKLILPGAILLAAFIVSGALLFVHLNKPAGDRDPNQKVNVSADDDPFLGNKKAPVTIIEFSDYQCPFCRSFWANTLPDLKKEYIDTGKVKFVYRDFPLSNIHSSAEIAAEAANCSIEQNKYWEFHDKIFSEQQKKGANTVTFTAADLKLWAGQIGLDMTKFNRCFDSGKYKGEIAKDIADGTAAQVGGTPAFFINGQLVVGAQPYAVFKEIIDRELK